MKDQDKKTEISINELLELKQAKNYLETIMDSSLDVIVISDSVGNIIRVNKYFVQLLDYKQDEVIGKHISELGPIVNKTYNCTTGESVHISGEYFEDRRKMYERFVKEQKTSNWQSYFVSKKDVLIPVEHKMSFFCDEKGNVLGAIGIIRDISERKQIAEKLRASRDYFSNIIESSLDSIVVTDKSGYLTRVNNAFLQLLGFSEAEVIGKHMSEFSPISAGTYECTTGELIQINEEFYNYIESKMLQFKEKGIMQNAISYLRRKDNKIVPVEDNMVYLLDKEGMRSGAFAITRDITERKKTEGKLLNYQSDLKSLATKLTVSEENERRRFAGYLHDQIGQQLCSMRISLASLTDGLSSNEDIKTLNHVLDTLKQTIDNTRNLTSEISPPVLYQFGLEAALEWLVEYIHRQHNIMVIFKDDKQEKPLDAEVKIFLYQAVRELLINVVKHARAENVEISISRNDSHIQICVKDDGVGYHSLDNDNHKPSHQGYGLFNIKQRLDQLGGQIEIESQPNCGTQVTLVAPLSSSV